MARWFRPRRPPVDSPPLVVAFQGFRRTLEVVEEAKSSLAGAAPSGRSPGVPLAEALAAFGEGLSAASSSLAGWRVSEVEAEWRACQEGLEDAASRAEQLRLEGAPEGYEQLYGMLDDAMEPLDEGFEAALQRFRDLGLYRS